MSELLFRLLVGSRLHGLAHAGSDYDFLEVYGWEKQEPLHTVTPTVDTLQISFSDFLRHANNGGPKFVEAMFAVDPEFSAIEHIRQSWYPDIKQCRAVYKGLIKRHWSKGVKHDKIKLKRHALRMQLNLWDLEDFGRFDPTLSLSDRLLVQSLEVGNEFPLENLGR